MSAGNEREHEIDDRIADWVDGRLSDRDHDRFVAELRVNPQLRRDLEEYERTVAAVREALQAPTVPAQLADRVLAAIAAGQAPVGGGAPLPRWRPLLWSLASAAALLVIAFWIDAWSAPVPEANLTAKSQSPGGPDGAWEQNDRAPAAGERPEAVRQVDLDELRLGNARLPQPVATDQREQPPAPAAQERQDASTSVLAGAGDDGRPASEPPVTTAVPGAAAPASPAERRAAGGAGPARPVTGAKGPPPADIVDRRDDAAPAADPGAMLRLEKTAAEQSEAAGAPAPTPASPPMPVDPLPLVVVLGRAPATADLFAARARADTKDKEAKAGAARVESRAADGPRGEAKAAEDAGRRFEAFFTAQVAEMTHVAPVGGGAVAKRARTKEPSEGVDQAMDAQRDAAVGWLQVADVRLLRLADSVAVTTGVVDRGEAATWIERDWLVDGARQDVAALLGRLASFTEAVQLQVRTGETTDVPAAKQQQIAGDRSEDFFLGRPGADRQRIVLRFRLQSR